MNRDKIAPEKLRELWTEGIGKNGLPRLEGSRYAVRQSLDCEASIFCGDRLELVVLAIWGKEAVVKIWLFALLQSFMAAIALAGWFYAENGVVAVAVAVAILGIAHPLIGVWKQRKLGAWRDRQHQRALTNLDADVKKALEEVIPPRMPFRPTVAAFLTAAGIGDPHDQLRRYDAVVDGIRNANTDCPSEAAAFSAEVRGNVLGVVLEGLAALATGQLKNAREFFEEAIQLNSAWALPWLGWATVCYLQQDLEELTSKHPHMNSVELLPYDCGDEELFLQLSESEREELGELFQQTVAALANYHTVADMEKSRSVCEELREEFRVAA